MSIEQTRKWDKIISFLPFGNDRRIFYLNTVDSNYGISIFCLRYVYFRHLEKCIIGRDLTMLRIRNPRGKYFANSAGRVSINLIVPVEFV